jgi:hypothetical protein
MMVEAKGDYADVLAVEPAMKKIIGDWLTQSKRQIDASGGRRVRWYFAEAETAIFARKLFNEVDEGRGRIEIVYHPWPKEKQ